MTTHLRPSDLGTILSVWAHPDDETYLAGGLMAAAADAGQRVVCVSATAGELGTDDPATWPPDRLAAVRRWEAAASMAVLGVADHRWLGHRDGSLATVERRVAVGQIAKLIIDVDPDTIITFGPDGMTFHPDHRVVSSWVGEARDRTGTAARLLHATTTTTQIELWGDLYERWGVFMTDERPTASPAPDLAVHLALHGAVLDRKVAALLAMHSQTAPAVALMGMDTFRAQNAVEAFVDADRVRRQATAHRRVALVT